MVAVVFGARGSVGPHVLAGLRAAGATMPPEVVEVTLRVWAAGVERRPPTSSIVQTLTGRPGWTFAAWARDHADDFRPV